MKRYKHIVLIVLVVILAAALLIWKSQPTREQSEQALDAEIQSMRQRKDYLLAYQKLHAGGYLCVLDNSPEDNPYDFKFITYNILTIKYGRPVFDFDGEDVIAAIGANDGLVDIFLEYHRGSNSYFFRYKSYNGTDILIFVMPNVNTGETYEESTEKDWVPYDTLDTDPFYFQDKMHHRNYPVWIFDIPEDSIDESYELHFGDFVLTGMDILSGTWDHPIK